MIRPSKLGAYGFFFISERVIMLPDASSEARVDLFELSVREGYIEVAQPAESISGGVKGHRR